MPSMTIPLSRLSLATALAATLLFAILGALLAQASYRGHKAEADQRLLMLVQESMVTLDAYLSIQSSTLSYAVRRLAEDGVGTLPALACELAADEPAPDCRSKLALITLTADRADEVAATPEAASACGAGVDPQAIVSRFQDASPLRTYLGPSVRRPDGSIRAAMIQPLDARRAVALCVDLDVLLAGWRRLAVQDGSAIALLKGLRTIWLRWPHVDGIINRDVSGGPLVRSILEAGAPRSGVAEFTPAYTDARSRRNLWLTSEQAPLTLVAGYASDRLFGDWLAAHWLELVALALICLAVPAGLLGAQWRGAKRQGEMRELLNRLDLATDAGGIGCWRYDFQTGRLEWTDKMFEIFGLDPAEFRGVFEDWRDRLHPDDAPAAEAAFLANSRGDVPFEFLFRVVRKTDGAVRWVRARSEVTLDERGRPAAANGVNMDVTETIEEQAQLANALGQAHEAMAARERFLATLSHELRTPLNAIIGFADLMRAMEPGGLPSDKRRAYLDDIHMSGEHLLSLINDMLDLAQLERGAPKLTLEPVQAAGAFADAVRVMSGRVEQAGLALEIVDSGALTALADRRALTQILLNLLSNAIKFTKPGGSVRLSARPAGPGRMEIRVEDDGCGIPASKIADLGQPFTKVDGGYHTTGEGAGLGLAIVSRLARAMGGRFQIESEWGAWTCARVILPSAETASAQTPTSAAEPKTSAAAQ
ncbi:MAG: ATP-binding protein [Marivibrio sp.]|uniref:sensor histidine kinase n=1 Tax=Marivibrio sp. TaxID=2039719 RepID=UPI0032ED0EEB